MLILSESFYDFDLVTDLQADTDIMPVTMATTFRTASRTQKTAVQTACREQHRRTTHC